MSRTLFSVLFVVTVVAIVGPAAFGQTTRTTGTTTGTTTGYGLGTLGGSAATADIGGQISGNERFMNRQLGQMVGGTGTAVGGIGGAGTTTGTGSAMSQFGQSQMFGNSPFGMGRMGGMSSLYTAGMMNAMANQRRQLRIPLRLGPNDGSNIAPAGPPTAVSIARLQTRLASNPRVQAMGSVSVLLEGETAVLKGWVATEHDRQLLQKMLYLEPGISDVHNELQIAAALRPPAPKP